MIGDGRFERLGQRSRRKAWLCRRRMYYRYIVPGSTMADAKRWFDFDTEILSK